MTRRSRKLMFSLGMIAALALIFANSITARSATADGRWLAAGKGGGSFAAAVKPDAPASHVAMRVRTATVPVGQPAPLLLPMSRPYFHTGTAAVALTFDDGPDPRWTPQILALLRQRHVKATFCLIGVNAKKYPGLVKQIVRDGHALCNHTMHHDEHLRDKSRAKIIADISQTNALITKVSGGVKPKYFRAPAGNWSPALVADARSLGLTSLGWQVDPRDWTKPPTSTIVSRVRAGTKPGSIILMHDGGGDRSRSVAALRILLPRFTTKYRLIRL